MSKVLNFLSYNPQVFNVLPGLIVSKPDPVKPVKASYERLIEVEEETKAHEESHIVLRLTLSESRRTISPHLELVRVSIEHGDEENISIELGSESDIQESYKAACRKLEVYSISIPNGDQMISEVVNLLPIVGHGTH